MTPLSARRNLFFDLDGTLTDPFEGITRSLEHALTELGCACASRDELRRCIGPPLRQTFTELLETSDATTIERAVAVYRDRYFSVGLFENRVYDGIEEMLRTLGRSGFDLWVVTSKVSVAATRILEHFELAGHFAAIYGSDLEGRLDDKGALIAYLLERERLAPEHCLMIGDRMHDAIGAARNGVPSLGVSWGFGSRQGLLDAGVVQLCDRPEEIVVAASTVLQAQPD